MSASGELPGALPVPSPNEQAAVDAGLAAAGISVAPDERARLIAMYAVYRPMVDALYAVPEVRYEVPALVFAAEPALENWGER